MSAKYWQRGETIDYTPTDDLANGDVVDLATRIGVAGNDIPAGETGAVHVVGVFEIPKATGAVTVGQALYWDKAAENITTAAGSSRSELPSRRATCGARRVTVPHSRARNSEVLALPSAIKVCWQASWTPKIPVAAI